MELAKPPFRPFRWPKLHGIIGPNPEQFEVVPTILFPLNKLSRFHVHVYKVFSPSRFSRKCHCYM